MPTAAATLRELIAAYPSFNMISSAASRIRRRFSSVAALGRRPSAIKFPRSIGPHLFYLEQAF
jgi:hypothetical protein